MSFANLTFNGYRLDFHSGAKFDARLSNHLHEVPTGYYQIGDNPVASYFSQPWMHFRPTGSGPAAGCEPANTTSSTAHRYRLTPATGLNFSPIRPYYLFDSSHSALSGIKVDAGFFRCIQHSPSALNANIEQMTLRVYYSSPWMRTAWQELGTSEVAGTAANARILEYFKASKFWGTDDSGGANAWCGSFAAWVMKQNGYTPPTDAFRAKEWKNFGKTISAPIYGAIGIKSRSGGGHVSFVVGKSADGQHLYMLGGNQSNEVNITKYSKSVWETFVVPEHFDISNESLPIYSGQSRNGGSES